MPLLLMEISFWPVVHISQGRQKSIAMVNTWSHKGLDKAYSKEIYQLIKNDWKKLVLCRKDLLMV